MTTYTHVIRDAKTRDRLLRRAEVEDQTGLARSTIYKLTAEGKFPPPVRLSARAVAFRASEIDAWIASRVSTLA